MKAHRITRDEAKAFFAHPSQQRGAKITPDALPDEGFQYWACGAVCGAFHAMPWPGVWGAHYGVKPDAWGHTKEPSLAILRAFSEAQRPALIVGWTDSRNRAAVAFARRIGFVETGRMALPDHQVIMQEFRP